MVESGAMHARLFDSALLTSGAKVCTGFDFLELRLSVFSSFASHIFTFDSLSGFIPASLSPTEGELKIEGAGSLGRSGGLGEEGWGAAGSI